MNQSEEEIKLLDEKIALIRKNNKAIIRKKKIFAAEIKQEKLSDAVFEINKSYSDQLDSKPALYSDSVEENNIRKQINVIESTVNQEIKRIVSNESEDEAWRRERRQIDSERIRRQKMASGWRREWDAHKVLEDNDIFWEPDHDNRFSSREQSADVTDSENNSWFSHRKFTDKNCNYQNEFVPNRSTKNFLSKTNEETEDSESTGWPSYRQTSSKLYNDDRSLNISNSWRNRKEPGKPKDIHELYQQKQDNLNAVKTNNNFSKCRVTSGPLIGNKNTASNNNIIVISNYKVTKYRNVQTQSGLEYLPWNCYNNYNLRKQNLNMVIHVSTEDDNTTRRVIEIINEDKSKNNLEYATTTDSLQNHKTMFERTDNQNDIPSEIGHICLPIQSNSGISSSLSGNINASDQSKISKDGRMTLRSSVDVLKRRSDISPPYCSYKNSKLGKNNLKRTEIVTLPKVDGEDDECENISDDERGCRE